MCVHSQDLRCFLTEVLQRAGSRKYIKRRDVLRIARRYEKLSHAPNLNMVCQMIDYYSREKKYLTLREVKYVVRTCEKWVE